MSSPDPSPHHQRVLAARAAVVVLIVGVVALGFAVWQFVDDDQGLAFVPLVLAVICAVSVTRLLLGIRRSRRRPDE